MSLGMKWQLPTLLYRPGDETNLKRLLNFSWCGMAEFYAAGFRFINNNAHLMKYP
jgi:hypothetical protein